MAVLGYLPDLLTPSCRTRSSIRGSSRGNSWRTSASTPCLTTYCSHYTWFCRFHQSEIRKDGSELGTATVKRVIWANTRYYASRRGDAASIVALLLVYYGLISIYFSGQKCNLKIFTDSPIIKIAFLHYKLKSDGKSSNRDKKIWNFGFRLTWYRNLIPPVI